MSAALDVVAGGVAIEELRLRHVATRLRIRPQSLYAHIDGVDGLHRAVAVAGLHALELRVLDASIGRSGADAVEAIIRAHLGFALDQPLLYVAALRPPDGNEELAAAMAAVGRPLDIVLDNLGLESEDRVHWTRLFLAVTTGFVGLHRRGALTLPVPVSDTAARLVEMLVGQLDSLVHAEH